MDDVLNLNASKRGRSSAAFEHSQAAVCFTFAALHDEELKQQWPTAMMIIIIEQSWVMSLECYPLRKVQGDEEEQVEEEQAGGRACRMEEGT